MSAPVARSIWKRYPEARQGSAQHTYERAKRDALKHIARDIPDASQYARYLPLDAVEAMRRVTKSRQYGWRCRMADAPLLRSYSLVGYSTDGLTGFGCHVLQALERQDA